MRVEDERKAKLIARDGLREWFVAQGFRVDPAPVWYANGGGDWYAYRKIVVPHRECECNFGEPMQLVVWPSSLEGFELEVVGEAEGLWYKVSCYGVTPSELKDKISKIEAALVAAWNALV